MIRLLTSVLLVLAVAAAAGQQPVAPQFRYQRPVQITSAGPQRLDVDVTLLTGGAPFTTAAADDRRIAVGGLSDLRLFTGDNVEVPYLLVGPPQTQPEWVQGRVLGVAAAEKASGEKTSGFEVDLGEPFVVDATQFIGMRTPFLKRFRLEGSGDRERWTLLVAEGTAFDLPSEALSQTVHAFTPGAYRYLRVTWDDTNSGRVPPPPVVRARHVQAAAPPPAALRTPLVVERQPSEPRVSRFRIRLPGGRLPVVALELSVGGEYLMREARVTEARLTGRQAVPQQIGRDVLRRVMQDGIAADALRIPIQQPSDAQLELVVDDGDNPPLDLQGVTAVFAELPWIYFEANPGTLTARYGGGTLAAPRYDLEAVRQNVASATTVPAIWGDAQPRIENAAAAPLPMPDAGGTIDVSGFQFARAIAAAPVGLVAVPLDAAALAHSATGTRFSDVRVVDNTGRQVPYLLERRDGPIALDVRLEQRDPGVPPAARNGRTTYVVPLPYRAMPSTRLALETRARVFQRAVTLAQLVPANEREREPRLQTLAGVRWVHADQAREPVPLVFDVPERRVGDLVLLIDEGDNQPLPIERARLLLPSYAVRLYQPRDQPLRLVYGNRGLGAPQYDLALLAPQVMGAPAREVYPGLEEAGAASQAAMALVPPPVFWGVLATAVIVLLGLIVRLVRKTAL